VEQTHAAQHVTVPYDQNRTRMPAKMHFRKTKA